MIILLYIILGLLVLLLIGYVINSVLKVKKSRPKIAKEKVKPVKEKKKESLIIGNKEPEFRPEVKAEEEKGAEQPVEVEELGQPEETNIESTIVKKDGKYIPSWDRDEDEEDDDTLEEYMHFPALSQSIRSGETLSEQIRNLPPEIQALMLSNIFDKKEN